MGISFVFDLDVYFSVLDYAAVGFYGCCWVFLVFSVAYVEFPSVAGAHDLVVSEDSCFEGAAHVGAAVLEGEDLVVFSYEQDGFAFDANGFHLVFFEFGFFYGWHKVVLAHCFWLHEVAVDCLGEWSGGQDLNLRQLGNCGLCRLE